MPWVQKKPRDTNRRNDRMSGVLRVIGKCAMHPVAAGFLCLLLAACGTGIELTEHVTDKDVQRIMGQTVNGLERMTLDPYADSLPAWRAGKGFWVADERVKQLFAYNAAYDIDTLNLAGRVLTYVKHETGGLFNDDNRFVEVTLFDSINGNTYTCRAGKAADTNRSGFTIPMLIDLDMVEHIARQVAGKDYYILTPIWYDRRTEQMTDGRHFIKVHLDSVLPGNAVLPLRVLFTATDTREQAMVWMSDNSSAMRGRDFDSMFATMDPHLAYPGITDANWERITRGQVCEGMTKEECRLAIGSPKRISENPDQGGMREYWYYDGGAYLFFVDGLLNQFRR